jgi:glycosyltransferase involved in cell wall biosynthesis
MKNYIYCHQAYNPNKGGVVGYLSCLYDSFEKTNPSLRTDNNIENCFLFPELSSAGKYFPLVKCEDNIVKKHLAPINEFRTKDKTIEYCQSWFNRCLPLQESVKIDFNELKSIHIHGAYNYPTIFNTLKKFNRDENTIKILTTHNPFKPEYDDMDFATRKGIYDKKDLEILSYYFNIRDEFAFKNCDALIFPTEESIEGYYNSWPKFDELIKNKKIYYCLTAANKKKATIPPKVLRESLGIPSNSKVFLYLGRFSTTRGYDILVEAAKRIIANRSDIYFLVVGESGLSPIISPNWIQIPFTTHPGDYIYMADACVCPNRGSLFDLSMIEILSLGTPLISCYVGGYKWLKDKTSGVFYCEQENVESLICEIYQFAKLDCQSIEKLRKNNIKLYSERLCIDLFQKNYCRVIDEIYNDFRDLIKHKIYTSCHIDIKKETFIQSTKSVLMPNKTVDISEKENQKATKKPDSSVHLSECISQQKEETVACKTLNPTIRKLRKLCTNPKLYFKDFWIKHFK